MTPLQRLFDPRFAFDSPVTVWICVLVASAIAVAFLVNLALYRSGRISQALYIEIKTRTKSWIWLALLIASPILLGAAWVFLAVMLLSLFCYNEYARATGLFRDRRISLVVVLGIFALTAAALDHWYGLFAAIVSLGPVAIAAVALTSDQPKGYIQRVALGIWAFMLFGASFGHLGYIANDTAYRPLLLLLIVCVQLNDIYAFISGKALGKKKLCPNTSPGKTVAGALGALLLTTLTVCIAGHFLLAEGFLGHPFHLIGAGVLISVTGQMGDLMLSSIKRDLAVKDIGQTIPGHGGLLDRFDSLLLAAPAAFHYIAYFRGIGEMQPARTISELFGA